MICYFPFSYLPEQQLRRLPALFPSWTIYQPAEFVATESMRRFAVQGALDLRTISGIDQGRLEVLVKEYKSWAEMRQGKRGGDLFNFAQALQGQTPLMDATNPSQLGTEIKHFGQARMGLGADPLLQAALFMAMAHQYDLQRDGLHARLGEVREMERRMYSQLAGQAEEIDEVVKEFSLSVEVSGGDEAGLYMTTERIRAWATLVAADPQRAAVYVTHSRAVWESVIDRFPEAIALGSITADSDPSRNLETMRAFVAAPDLRAVESKPQAESSGQPRIILHGLKGCTPQYFCARLTGSKQTQAVPPDTTGAAHTLIILLAE
jgi:hypothetical protein